MFTALDFKYIYENNALPKGKSLSDFSQPIINTQKKDEVLREWFAIEKRLFLLAKSLLEKDSPTSVPPEFYLWIQYKENLARLVNDLKFKAKHIQMPSCDYAYLVNFL